MALPRGAAGCKLDTFNTGWPSQKLFGDDAVWDFWLWKRPKELASQHNQFKNHFLNYSSRRMRNSRDRIKKSGMQNTSPVTNSSPLAVLTQIGAKKGPIRLVNNLNGHFGHVFQAITLQSMVSSKSRPSCGKQANVIVNPIAVSNSLPFVAEMMKVVPNCTLNQQEALKSPEIHPTVGKYHQFVMWSVHVVAEAAINYSSLKNTPRKGGVAQLGLLDKEFVYGEHDLVWVPKLMLTSTDAKTPFCTRTHSKTLDLDSRPVLCERLLPVASFHPHGSHSNTWPRAVHWPHRIRHCLNNSAPFAIQPDPQGRFTKNHPCRSHYGHLGSPDLFSCPLKGQGYAVKNKA
jgi:hypothetical protein